MLQIKHLTTQSLAPKFSGAFSQSLRPNSSRSHHCYFTKLSLIRTEVASWWPPWSCQACSHAWFAPSSNLESEHKVQFPVSLENSEKVHYSRAKGWLILLCWLGQSLDTGPEGLLFQAYDCCHELCTGMVSQPTPPHKARSYCSRESLCGNRPVADQRHMGQKAKGNSPSSVGSLVDDTE